MGGDQLFDYSGAAMPVPADLTALFKTTWEELARPGNGWTAFEKVGLAAAARQSRASGEKPSSQALSGKTVDLVHLMVNAPAEIDRELASAATDYLGVVRYVELVGWVSIVIGIDVFQQLLGLEPAPLPQPSAGKPSEVGEVSSLRMRKAWVPTTGLPLPRFALSAVPRTQRVANLILDRMYKPQDDRHSSRSIRGLSHTQLELVVSTVSYGNRCFYCTLGHLTALRAAADREGVTLQMGGIVDPDQDTGVKGGAQLVAMARSAVSPRPDPSTVTNLAREVGQPAAVTAAEVAACFMMINRIVEATGQPALTRQRERMRPLLSELGVLEFPHAGLTTERERPGMIRRVIRKLRK